MSLQGKFDDLFAYAMKGQWDEVLQIYEKYPGAQKAKITKSEDTALHIAVSVGETDVAVELVGISHDGILEIENAKGNTALHIAAALGDLTVCTCLVSKNPYLIHMRNIYGETPLFLAALHGKRETFLYLHPLSKEEDLVRRNDGDNILHAAIAGDYFSLAMSIIHCYPGLADAVNENGLSPLHILASKPNAFQSSTRLGLFDRIIYQCLVIDELKEESPDVEAYIAKKSKKRKETLKYPENYVTCINLFGVLSFVFQTWILSLRGLHQSLSQVLKWKKESRDDTADEENPQQKSNSVQVGTLGISSTAMSSKSKGATKEPSKNLRMSHAKDKVGRERKIGEENVLKTSLSQGIKQSESQGCVGGQFPPNYDKIVLFLKLILKALLIILGIGIWRIKKIQRKKELHIWANCALDELVKHTTSYKFYENTGLDPKQIRGEKVEEEFAVLNDPINMSDQGKGLTSASRFKYYQKRRSDQIEIGKRRTPILVAANMGVTEVVEKILDKFPVAIQDLDSDNKNVVLLAVENRQPQVYNLLLNRKNIMKESVFRQLDKDGNSALHLAAQCK
ncbi:Transmembrane protein [Trema orientale]|uniref:Transmembrane protein n=1 Tax=Trema orientale TaxID=63057 RepID=A0A2P5F400_TREOI|nr:Transmembrane protein [Trema orientale]